MNRYLMAVIFAACLNASVPAHAVDISADEYAMRVPATQSAGTRMHITVIDSRPYVLNGESAETYEGMTRELYGIPISRNTSDKSTMASYLGKRLQLGFEKAGYVATYQPSIKGSEPAKRVMDIAGDTQDLIFLVNLREWSYDQGFARPQFTHDITINIYNGKGELLATEDFSGVNAMPTGGWKHYKRRYAELYQTIFDQVFSATLVTTGLAGTPTASAPSTSTKLTLEQRLSQLRELREKGLIDEETFREQEKGILSEI